MNKLHMLIVEAGVCAKEKMIAVLEQEYVFCIVAFGVRAVSSVPSLSALCSDPLPRGMW